MLLISVSWFENWKSGNQFFRLSSEYNWHCVFCCVSTANVCHKPSFLNISGWLMRNPIVENLGSSCSHHQHNTGIIVLHNIFSSLSFPDEKVCMEMVKWEAFLYCYQSGLGEGNWVIYLFNYFICFSLAVSWVKSFASFGFLYRTSIGAKWESMVLVSCDTYWLSALGQGIGLPL